MGISPTNIADIEVRLARTSEEVEAAQRLRYKVFYEEFQARPTEEMARLRLDFDEYDAVTDHLVVIDRSIAEASESIVGTYRMFREEPANRFGRFYTSGEYDISPLLCANMSLLELGRSCVLAEYRTRPIMQLLWQGITDYILTHNVGLMFGCASLHGTDIDALAPQLSYLYHFHLADADLCPRALDDRFVDMNILSREDIDERAVFASLPPLIKGYLRIGANIGNGAVIDEQFNTTDVCIVLPTDKVTSRYRNHYERKVAQAGTTMAPPAQKPLSGDERGREREIELDVDLGLFTPPFQTA